jgi:hypothetical protein
MSANRSLKGLTAALLAAGLWGASAAHAASVSYYLDQTNTHPELSDGVNYLVVTLDDNTPSSIGGNDNLITFTVSTVPGAFTEGDNFGIQSFGFNNPTGPALSASNILAPTGWSIDAPPPSQLDGFGAFDWVISDGGSSRQDPLVFSIDLHGDSFDDYFGFSSGTAGQGNAWFAAHVAGFVIDDSEVSSAWFGGGDGGGSPPNVVPVPAAVWLLGSGLLGLIGLARRKNVA